tara:strand:+ start:1596 stop:2462 length:867 start_codon:yes stop_codon:yes gene_type:complete
LKNLLGIGTAGCNVVSQLSKYDSYASYYISNEIEKTTKYKFSLEVATNPEEYENMDMKKLHSWLSKIKDQASVFLCGACESTGITLRALEKLHKQGVIMDIVYFMPEVEVLSDTKTLLERTTRGVLQNYARSGLFQKICLVSNLELESLAGDTNVYEYYNQINSVFTSTYYMMDVFRNNKPVTSTFKIPKESCKITTIGISEINGEDKLFFPLTSEAEIVYYYGINEEKLKTEHNLFRTITNNIKSKITNNTKVSFGIYSTNYENDYVYAEYFSPKIQKIALDEEAEV